MEAGDVLAVAVDLVGLDEVGEHEAVLELVRSARVVAAIAAAFVGAGVLVVDADVVEHRADLADRVDRDAVGLQLVEVGAAGRVEREVLAPLRALERAGRAA